jgi:hypothetical protein
MEGPTQTDLRELILHVVQEQQPRGYMGPRVQQESALLHSSFSTTPPETAVIRRNS